VPTGRSLLLRLLPHVVRQCSACPDAARFVVTVSAYLRFKVMPRYHNNVRRGRCPHRPCFWNSSTIALNHRTRPAWVRWGALVYLRTSCVGTRNVLPHRNSAGRGAGWLRQILVGTRRHLPLAHRAKARHSAALSGFGRTDTFTCRNATRLSPKAASLVPFLPRQERNRPPRRRLAVSRGAASPYLQTPHSPAHGYTHPLRVAARLRHHQRPW
jgi:hypothetical protein